MLNFENNFPMGQITTLQIGGPAKKLVAVATQEELIEAIQYAKSQQMPYLVVGGGSNLLVADEGVDCLIIKNEMTGITTSQESKPCPLTPERSDGRRATCEVSVKSGTLLQELVDYAISHGLTGLQKLAGIPGTVGGAAYGNAGAYGQTISDHITEVVILGTIRHSPERTPESDSGQARLPDGQARMTLSKDKCRFNYRNSIFKKNKDTILEIVFQLEPGDPKILAEETRDVLSKRLVKYPHGIKCPGSFFKNLVASEISSEILKNIPPEKIVYGKLPAGALLEEVGAKGQSLDGIEIASYHANLFINQGSGSAKAFYDLAKTYAEKVKERFGISLQPEVQLINLPPLN